MPSIEITAAISEPSILDRVCSEIETKMSVLMGRRTQADSDDIEHAIQSILNRLLPKVPCDVFVRDDGRGGFSVSIAYGGDSPPNGYMQ